MTKRKCSFADGMVLHHEQDNASKRHRLIADDGVSPWHPFEQVISYDKGGRYFAAIMKAGWPECFEITPPREAVLTNVGVV